MSSSQHSSPELIWDEFTFFRASGAITREAGSWRASDLRGEANALSETPEGRVEGLKFVPKESPMLN